MLNGIVKMLQEFSTKLLFLGIKNSDVFDF